jgi:hypothetical protein
MAYKVTYEAPNDGVERPSVFGNRSHAEFYAREMSEHTGKPARVVDTETGAEVFAVDGESETEIVEDDRRRLRDGRIEVRGTWVLRGAAAGSRRREHTRERPLRRG